MKSRVLDSTTFDHFLLWSPGNAVSFPHIPPQVLQRVTVLKPTTGWTKDSINGELCRFFDSFAWQLSLKSRNLLFLLKLRTKRALISNRRIYRRLFYLNKMQEERLHRIQKARRRVCRTNSSPGVSDFLGDPAAPSDFLCISQLGAEHQKSWGSCRVYLVMISENVAWNERRSLLCFTDNS